jgi:hypothetical protein
VQPFTSRVERAVAAAELQPRPITIDVARTGSTAAELGSTEGSSKMRQVSTQPAVTTRHGRVVDRPQYPVRATRRVAPAELSRLARLRSAIDARRWMVAVVNIAAAGCFVIGSVGFYWPAWYAPSVTLFLVGSTSFLLAASAAALAEHGPDT